MKKVEAIVKPSKLKAIQKGLIDADIPCMTVVPVRGAGLQQGYSEIYRGTEKSMILFPNLFLIPGFILSNPKYHFLTLSFIISCPK